MNKKQIKKILTVLIGIASIIFLGMVINGYFNIVVFFIDACLVGGLRLVSDGVKVDNNNNKYQHHDDVVINSDGYVNYNSVFKRDFKNKAKVRVRKKN